MTPAEQEQRVLCEVLQGYGYAVGVLGYLCRWGEHATGWVVWGRGGYVVNPGNTHGPVCDTPEEAIAWVLDNVPRPTAPDAAP